MNKFKQIKISLLVFAVLLVASCKKENSCDCFKRTGTIVTVNREISGFDKLFVEDNLNVFITQGPVFDVKIESGENLISLIKTEVTDGTLYIQNKNRCNWTRSYDKPFNVYITMPVLNFLTSDGTGTIRSLNTITTPEFDIQTKNSGDIELVVNNSKITSHMHGSGDLTLHGHTMEHNCDIGGTAFLNCKDLVTDKTYVHSYTTGLCYVTTLGTLDCRIDRIGDVYCYGDPVIVQEFIQGKGKLYLK